MTRGDSMLAMRIWMGILAIAMVGCGKGEDNDAEGAAEAVDERARERGAGAETPTDVPVLTVGERSTPLQTVLLVEDAEPDPADRHNQIVLLDVPPGPYPCAGIRRLLGAKQYLEVATTAPLESGSRPGSDEDDNRMYLRGSEIEGNRMPLRGELEGEVHIETVDRDARTARGSLSLTAAGVGVEGTFEAIVCPTRIVARDEAAPIHDMEWTMESVDPDEIPDEPAEGFVFDGFEIAHVNARPPRTRAHDDWTITFFREDPDAACAHGRGGFTGDRDRGIEPVGALTDGFVLHVEESELEAGSTLGATNTRDADDDTMRGEAFFTEPDGARGGRYAQYSNTAVVVESLDREQGTLTGRAYIAIDAAAKPLLVGAFEARICDG